MHVMAYYHASALKNLRMYEIVISNRISLRTGSLEGFKRISESTKHKNLESEAIGAGKLK